MIVKTSEEIPLYCYDLADPYFFSINPKDCKPTIREIDISHWYEMRTDERYENKLVYRHDGKIPPVVADVLE